MREGRAVLAPFEGELLFVVDAFAVKLFAVGKFSLGFHSADLAVVGDFNFGGADLLASFFQSGCDLVAAMGLKAMESAPPGIPLPETGVSLLSYLVEKL